MYRKYRRGYFPNKSVHKSPEHTGEYIYSRSQPKSIPFCTKCDRGRGCCNENEKHRYTLHHKNTRRSGMGRKDDRYDKRNIHNHIRREFEEINLDI